ncbi:NUDIX domain-containing protein [Pseudonocardia sp. ICBG1293]|uniref:NUDIX domain-containing protein n=1 Tax=Pseudonocardia sp. ICBG1293 TaxID=2844382 RepID=UPI001CCF9EBF|nr:NUDIX domain-containing protein [Pseudonocardia sp. ICBG1293]
MLSEQLRTDGAEVDPAGIADVVAAGTVPWRHADDGTLEVALVHRPRYDDWSWPKGHQDPGEALTLTALRETAEEAHTWSAASAPGSVTPPTRCPAGGTRSCTTGPPRWSATTASP